MYPPTDMLGALFFARPSPEVARDLIGARLLVDAALGCAGGMIVEVEAYAPDDPASHSFNGQTPRNAAMFGPPGRVYVYRSYGIHWCLNFVCRQASAVLIRAIQPLYGLDVMAERRGVVDPRLLCSGPGRLCQALAITRAYDGLPLDTPPFELYASEEAPIVSVGPRIGITKATDVPWRFGLTGSRFLSRPFR